VSSFTAGTEEAQKCFPWTGATELQLHIWREKKGCPVHTRLQRMQGREISKTSRKWLQRREGNADGVQYHANYISRMGLFSYDIV
jgi:hypothetical protein